MSSQDPKNDPDDQSPTPLATDRSPTRPRWVKVFLIIAIVLIVLVLIGLLTGQLGPGGPHGPGRHMGSESLRILGD